MPSQKKLIIILIIITISSSKLQSYSNEQEYAGTPLTYISQLNEDILIDEQSIGQQNMRNQQKLNQLHNIGKQQKFYCGESLNQWNQDVLPRSVPAHIQVRQRQKLVSTVYGFDIFVDALDNTVSKSIANHGTWEPGFINLFGHIIQPGFCVLNLGSQSGLEAVVMGKIIGPNGKLFIFQPYSFSNSLVTKNIELNGLQNITKIYKYGASDKKSTAIIEISYGNTGGSKIFAQNQSKPLNSMRNGQFINQKQVVNLERVDQLLPKDTILNFALIDVEQMQVEALTGMKQIIARSPNLIIMTEWQYKLNAKANKQSTLSFLSFMLEKGYKIYSYLNGGKMNKNVQNCQMGKFHQYRKVDTLLNLNMIDIFFIPGNYYVPT